MIFLFFLLLPEICFANCPESFQNKCYCGKIRIIPNKKAKEIEHYVVNCTNTHFTNSDPLKDLPEETEVLLFTGNYLYELPKNIFGELAKSNDKLKYIDMSHNRITFIKGKTFHKVSNVETLILNFNDISITGKKSRPRMFSNFENLKNLHLTDAFADIDNEATNFILSLKDIFDESLLITLKILHLEQNEIQKIGTNESIFCSLFDIQHLYLADNKLKDMDFQIDCLDKLNYIDLRFNSINRLSDDAMQRIENFEKFHNNKLHMNMRDNPFICDSRAKTFIHWVKTTSIELHETEKYICQDGYPVENVYKQIKEVKTKSCPNAENTVIEVVKVVEYSAETVKFLSLVIAVLITATIFLVYYHKKKMFVLKQPILDEFTSKMGHTGVAKEDSFQPATV